MGVRCAAAIALTGVVIWPAMSSGQETHGDGPLELELREKTERRLAQIDVTVLGPQDLITGLTADDFELVVDGRLVDRLFADPLCATPDERAALSSDAASPEVGRSGATPPAVAFVAHYLFYFDQAHLTPMGRARSLDLARDLVQELIVNGSRASVVSAAQDVQTFVGFTDDRKRLAEALGDLAGDKSQWDSYAMLEDSRVSEIQEAFARGVGEAADLAKRHAFEDRWRTEKALRRLSMVVGRMAELPPPRMLVYFADKMRSRPGEHYLYLFSENDLEQMRAGRLPKLAKVVASHAAGLSYDSVVRKANGHGVRLYTVQAEGLVSGFSAAEKPMSALSPTAGGGRRAVKSNVARQVRRVAPLPGLKRIDDAQAGLAGFASETGGRSFLDGVASKKIAEQIRTDVGCFYLLSFDPSAFPADESLSVLVKSKIPGVTVRTRSRTVFLSGSARLQSRLISAFAAPETIDATAALETLVVPIDFDHGEYSALVQVAAPGSPMSGSQWSLGASLISSGKVKQDASGSISISGPRVPVVFETEWRFGPGPYEIVAVAHETAAGDILTGRVENAWPDPDDHPASVTGIAVVQPQDAAFSRAGELRTRGSLALAPGTPVRVDRPTALIGLVCRGRHHHRALLVDRRLRGADEVRFEEMTIQLGDQRCTQIRDIIPPDTMTSGGFVYEVRVLDGAEQVAGANREFFAIDGNAATATTSPPNDESP